MVTLLRFAYSAKLSNNLGSRNIGQLLGFKMGEQLLALYLVIVQFFATDLLLAVSALNVDFVINMNRSCSLQYMRLLVSLLRFIVRFLN